MGGTRTRLAPGAPPLMSERRQFDEHVHALRDISGILRAMKNLALMETQKLGRFLTTQRRVVEGIEAAAQDFFAFYPDATRQLGKGQPVWLVIGSERGFCGDYNERLLEGVKQRFREHSQKHLPLVVVGQKLDGKLAHDHQVLAALRGPTVVEDVPSTLIELMDKLRELQSTQKPETRLEFTIAHHHPNAEGGLIQVHEPIKGATHAAGFAYPPMLHLAPLRFARELIDHHLFRLLHEVFYGSLMAENLFRFQHMDQALQQLDKDIAQLTLRRNTLCQEEITEEIELIMLSAELLTQQQ